MGLVNSGWLITLSLYVWTIKMCDLQFNHGNYRFFQWQQWQPFCSKYIVNYQKSMKFSGISRDFKSVTANPQLQYRGPLSGVLFSTSSKHLVNNALYKYSEHCHKIKAYWLLFLFYLKITIQRYISYSMKLLWKHLYVIITD